MAKKIHAYGGVAEERTYRGVGHLTLIGAFAPAVTREADLSMLERRRYRAGHSCAWINVGRVDSKLACRKFRGRSC